MKLGNNNNLGMSYIRSLYLSQERMQDTVTKKNEKNHHITRFVISI